MGGDRASLRRAARADLRAGRRDQPQGRAGGALRRRVESPHRAARRGLLGLLLRRRRKGGRRPLRQGAAADGAARQGPHARPGPGRSRPSTSSRSRGTRRVTQRFARKVEFESIEFNKRFLATVPSEYDPVKLRELFSPGFLAWTTTMTGEIDFGINDRQLWFLWHLRERSEAELKEALKNAGQLFKRLQGEMDESGIHTYPPGPWHAGLAPFPAGYEGRSQPVLSLRRGSRGRPGGRRGAAPGCRSPWAGSARPRARGGPRSPRRRCDRAAATRAG